jgi:hypothetical protein
MRSAVHAVKRALDETASPTRVTRAHEKFLRRIHGKERPLDPSPLSERWVTAYDHLVRELGTIVKKPWSGESLYASSVVDAFKFTELWAQLYGPTDNASIRPANRYSLEWTHRDSATNAGNDVASKATGHLHVVNVLSPLPPVGTALGSFTGATANAGVGFLLRPKYTLTRIKMTPVVSYNYHYIVDHPVNSTLSIAKSQGSLRLVCYRVNPFTQTSTLFAEWVKPLWNVENQPIASRHEGDKSGVFNGFPVQLDVDASGDFLYALLCVATVQVTRGFYGKTVGIPLEPTLCTGTLECHVPAMWLEQEQLA